MSQTYDICIRGAGIVGRTLALHLAAKRLKVALVASSPVNAAIDTDVRAYALNQSSRTLLEAVRCWPSDESATPVLHMQVEADAQALVNFSASSQGAAALNWIVDVPVLERQLAQAVQFQPLITVVQAPLPATLTVVCEGRASVTREKCNIEFAVHRYEQWAVAARVESEFPHGQTARQWFNEGEITALLPIKGAQGNSHALVWSAHPERAQQLMRNTDLEFTDALQTATRMAIGTLRLSSHRASWPLQHAVARQWTGIAPMAGEQSAWVLAGDAAHNVHPLAGQGLNLGLGDVAELVNVLDHRGYWRAVDDMRLLRQYERARKAAFAMMGGSGDFLQQLFSHPHALVHSARSWGMRGFNHLPPLKRWVAQRAMGL